jgi:hypothetical protein
MKTFYIAALALLLVGCNTTPQRNAPLTAEQVRILALHLANEKASVLYNCQPFQSGQPARLVQGQWVWTNRQGYGHSDIEATVEIAPDGSTHTVDLKLLNSQGLF